MLLIFMPLVTADIDADMICYYYAVDSVFACDSDVAILLTYAVVYVDIIAATAC